MKRATLLTVGAGLNLAFGGQAMADPTLSAEVQSQAKQLAALQKHVEILQEEQEDHGCRITAIEETQEKTRQLLATMKELERELATVRSGTIQLNEEFSQYRKDYQRSARVQAAGEQHSALSTHSGKHYEDVTIRKVTDAGIEVRHANGTARILHSDLPAEFQDRFQWNREVAEALLTAENERAALRDRIMQVAARQDAQEKAEQERAARHEERFSKIETEIAQISARQSSLDSSSRLGETRTLGTGRSSRYYYGYSRYRDRPTIYYYPVRPSTRARSTTGGTRYNARTWMTNRPRPTPRPAPMRVCPNGTD